MLTSGRRGIRREDRFVDEEDGDVDMDDAYQACGFELRDEIKHFIASEELTDLFCASLSYILKVILSYSEFCPKRLVYPCQTLSLLLRGRTTESDKSLQLEFWKLL